MKSHLFLLFLFSSISGEEILPIEKNLQLYYSEAAETPEACIFVPPIGWLTADPAILPENVLVMVIGKGKSSYPPSINLGIEPYAGTVKNYLRIIQSINESQNAKFKDLGQIATESGNASLCQIDMKTEWGDVRQLHGIVVRYGSAYILTAAALKEEFPDYYKDFFQAIRSMKINKDVFEQVKSLDKRAKIQNEISRLKSEWLKLQANQNQKGDALFDSEAFQGKYWGPFMELLSKEFGEMGPKWRDDLIEKVKNELQ